jgi:UDP-N-acetylmuramyl pentapeptide phosphotransferase/UDP-N-acetylglucosamine-1-phosphate transferase
LKNIILLCVLSSGLSIFITYLIRFFALKYNLIDNPNDRSSHVIPTPRGGGVAIVIAWYLGIAVLFYHGLIDKLLFHALICGAVLAIISFIDDVVNLKPFIRLFFQFITAISAFIILKGINPLDIWGFKLSYSYLLYPVSIIGIIWFINLFNFLDGIDGYASLEAISIALAFFIFSGNYISIVLIACISGFLFWNWPKAKIFMGDVGSTQLGFILIVLGIYFHNKTEISIISWVMLTSVFWFDATYTLFRRWKNKEILTQAHRKHAYQRLVQSGFSHLQTDLFLIGINSIIILLVYICKIFSYLELPFLIIITLCLFLLTKLIDKRKSF